MKCIKYLLFAAVILGFYSCEKIDSDAIVLSTRIKLNKVLKTDNGILLEWNKLSFDVSQYAVLRYEEIPENGVFTCVVTNWNNDEWETNCNQLDYRHVIGYVENLDLCKYVDQSPGLVKHYYYAVVAFTPDTLLVSNFRVYDTGYEGELLKLNTGFIQQIMNSENVLFTRDRYLYNYNLTNGEYVDSFYFEDGMNPYNLKITSVEATNGYKLYVYNDYNIYDFKTNSLQLDSKTYIGISVQDMLAVDKEYLMFLDSYEAKFYNISSSMVTSSEYLNDYFRSAFFIKGELYFFENYSSYSNVASYNYVNGSLGVKLSSDNINNINLEEIWEFPNEVRFIGISGDVINKDFNDVGGLKINAIKDLQNNDYEIESVTFDENGKYIYISVRNNKGIYVYDRSSFEYIKKLETFAMPIKLVVNGNTLFAFSVEPINNSMFVNYNNVGLEKFTIE